MVEIKQKLPEHFPPAKMPPLQRLIVLALATGHADEWWSADDVVRATGVVRRSALKHLRALTEAGFVGERVNSDNGRKTYKLKLTEAKNGDRI